MKKSISLNKVKDIITGLEEDFNLDDEVVVDYVDYVVDVDNMISNYVDRYGYSK